jgi:hypothetical protein
MCNPYCVSKTCDITPTGGAGGNGRKFGHELGQLRIFHQAAVAGRSGVVGKKLGHFLDRDVARQNRIPDGRDNFHGLVPRLLGDFGFSDDVRNADNLGKRRKRIRRQAIVPLAYVGRRCLDGPHLVAAKLVRQNAIPVFFPEFGLDLDDALLVDLFQLGLTSNLCGHQANLLIECLINLNIRDGKSRVSLGVDDEYVLVHELLDRRTPQIVRIRNLLLVHHTGHETVHIGFEYDVIAYDGDDLIKHFFRLREARNGSRHRQDNSQEKQQGTRMSHIEYLEGRLALSEAGSPGRNSSMRR